MRSRNRLTIAGITVLAGVVAGFVAFASPASAGAGSAAASDSATALSSTAIGTITTTTASTEAAKKKKDPCEAGAALDSESGKWRATVSCDDWTAVLPGTYETRQEALDNSESYAKGVNSKVMDGPGCLPPFVLC